MRADDIPIAHTPDGGWQGEMPPPVLAACDEPPAPGAPDLRCTWHAFRVERDGQPLEEHALNRHAERIEQCGDRVVITGGGVIHDMRADGTLEHGVDDVAAADFTTRVRVAAVFNHGRLDLHPGGVDSARPPLVTREVVGDELIWHYGPFAVLMRRLSEPAEAEARKEAHT
jgi:hypothetical protein